MSYCIHRINCSEFDTNYCQSISHELMPCFNYKPKMNYYEGCNPKIAESLKKGVHIKCRVKNASWDNDTCYILTNTICAFVKGKYMSTTGNIWDIAEPGTITETRVKGPVEIMTALINAGYSINCEGNWDIEGDDEATMFLTYMWHYCGDKRPKIGYKWEPEWLEEVEI